MLRYHPCRWLGWIASSFLAVALTGFGAGIQSHVSHAGSPAADSSTTELPSLTTIDRETSRILRWHSEILKPKSHSNADFRKRTERLCNWYAVLKSDPRQNESPMLAKTTATVRRRLLNASKGEAARLKRAGVERANSKEIDSKIQIQWKQLLKKRGNQDQPGSNLNSGDDDMDSSGTSSQIANNRRGSSGKHGSHNGGRLGNSSGGQNGNAAGNGMFDNGWDLVDLIQRIVQPDFWETKGGPGVMHYFAARKVLVVRATSDVHEQIKDLLIALR